jgi:hypothetical protein
MCILSSSLLLVGLIIYFIYGIHNSVEGKGDDSNKKDELKLIMPPPPDKLYDMKQIQPENQKQALKDDFNDNDDDDEPRYVEH